MPLHRLPTLGSRIARALAEQAGRGAVGNARTAAAAIIEQVADRRRLDPGGADDEPGALSRISREECIALLATRSVGRLAYIARAGVPDIVPVNYAMNGQDVLVQVRRRTEAAGRRAG